jgi:uncharacterized protein YkwD
MQIQAVDLFLLAIVLLGAWGGWSRGFLAAALDLVTLAASLAVAFLGYRPVADWLARVVPAWEVWLPPLAFLVLFLLTQAVLASIEMRLLVRLPQGVHRNVANRLLGLAPGLVKGAIHAVIAAVLLLTLPLGPTVAQWAQDSTLAARLAAPAEWVEARLAPIFDPAIQRSLQALTVRPESRERINLPFRTSNGKPRPDLEERMLEMVNRERRAAGLKPVQLDPALTPVARGHSQDMLARGYFSHYSPEGEDLGRRMRASRVGYLAAGENLALAPTLAGAHNGLMRSPGHRANILRPQFGRLGIGILDSGGHGLMVTQVFRN